MGSWRRQFACNAAGTLSEAGVVILEYDYTEFAAAAHAVVGNRKKAAVLSGAGRGGPLRYEGLLQMTILSDLLKTYAAQASPGCYIENFNCRETP